MFVIPDPGVAPVWWYVCLEGPYDGFEACLELDVGEMRFPRDTTTAMPERSIASQNNRNHGHPYNTGTEFTLYAFRGEIRNNMRVMIYVGITK